MVFLLRIMGACRRSSAGASAHRSAQQERTSSQIFSDPYRTKWEHKGDLLMSRWSAIVTLTAAPDK